MTIYFLTREPDACQLIADAFESYNAEITIFVTISTLFENVFEKNIKPDILFLDYLYYLPDMFNPYTVLKKYKKMFPIVFYNHPFPQKDKRSFFWLSTLKKTKYFSDLSNIKPLLHTLEDALKNPEIAPYVTGIQQPKFYRSKNLRYIAPLKDNEIEYYTKTFDNVVSASFAKETFKHPESDTKVFQKNINNSSTNFLNEFRVKNHLSHKVFSLLSILYKKRNTHITLSELSNTIEDGKKTISTNGIRIIIHRLRKILSEDQTTNLDLISFDHGYMLVEKNKTSPTNANA